MRVNVYAEEMTQRIEIISKTIDEQTFTGLRFYLELPVTVGGPEGAHRSTEGPTVLVPINGKPAQVAGPFMHRPGDDDSAAITFWGKRDLRLVLRKALKMLDEHYSGQQKSGITTPYYVIRTKKYCGAIAGATVVYLQKTSWNSKSGVRELILTPYRKHALHFYNRDDALFMCCNFKALAEAKVIKVVKKNPVAPTAGDLVKAKKESR
jgi:hypothetical protein